MFMKDKESYEICGATPYTTIVLEFQHNNSCGFENSPMAFVQILFSSYMYSGHSIHGDRMNAIHDHQVLKKVMKVFTFAFHVSSVAKILYDSINSHASIHLLTHKIIRERLLYSVSEARDHLQSWFVGFLAKYNLAEYFKKGYPMLPSLQEGVSRGWGGREIPVLVFGLLKSKLLTKLDRVDNTPDHWCYLQILINSLPLGHVSRFLYPLVLGFTHLFVFLFFSPPGPFTDTPDPYPSVSSQDDPSLNPFERKDKKPVYLPANINSICSVKYQYHVIDNYHNIFFCTCSLDSPKLELSNFMYSNISYLRRNRFDDPTIINYMDDLPQLVEVPPKIPDNRSSSLHERHKFYDNHHDGEEDSVTMDVNGNPIGMKFLAIQNSQKLRHILIEDCTSEEDGETFHMWLDRVDGLVQLFCQQEGMRTV
eukprot:TRINITY_DN12562_c0_g3_i1.p1 TRINITY_DN12562_c0_g3~~TRINITY_DN12562_c0_g3_i1.p1  ORF type:complete len:423 (-),score=74.26 TRINITY_DN12562_c0_g3_i1:80-1348(-)